MTAAELQRRIDRAWMKAGCKSGERRDGGRTSDFAEISSERNSNVQTPYLDLWLTVLDEFIAWEISLLLLVYTPFLEGKRPKPTAFDKCVYIVLMRIVGDSFAFRKLILSGFDVSAKTVLRSLAEYMELYVALLDDPTFADEFIKADTPESSKKFWQEHLRAKNIRKRLRKAWCNFFKDSSSEAARWFAEWGSSTYEILGGLAHPSFSGGYFTAIPLKTVYPEENWLGFWGDKSEASAQTIQFYCRFMLPILLLNDYPFKRGYPSSLRTRFSGKSEFHRHVRGGRGVLASLIMSLCAEDFHDQVFPSFDLSGGRDRRDG